MKKEIKGLRKLSTEEMEKVNGGNCFAAMSNFNNAMQLHSQVQSDASATYLWLSFIEMGRACEM